MIKLTIRLLLPCVFIFTVGISFGQKHFPRYIDSLEYVGHTDSLKHLFGCNKTIPAEYELAVLAALSAYPELAYTDIAFKESTINTTMNARPVMLSVLFKNKTERKYIIRINNSHKSRSIPLSKVNFNAQAGIIGHELAHIYDYTQTNAFGVLLRGTAYTNNLSKRKFEHKIDRITIEKGLGWQLYDWATFVLYGSDATKQYKAFKRDIYLCPEQIKTQMKECGYEISPHNDTHYK